MSFDISIQVPDDSPEARVIEAIVNRDRITPAEAVLAALRSVASKDLVVGATPKKGKTSKVKPLTDEELRHLESAFPGLGLLEDVTDEEWARILKGAQRMGQEGFPKRA